MPKTIQRHIDAIKAGEVDKSNVIGLRKALNAFERMARGYSTSSTSAKMTETQRAYILDDLLPNTRPRVVGELHDTGKATLQNKRYRRQLESVADIVADLDHFRLVGFDFVGNWGMYATPVYRAYDTKGASFPFCVIPWQSGGNGPQIMSANYW